MTEKDKVKIEYVPLSELTRHERNPKEHDLGEIRASVRRFGYTSPILIDEKSQKIVAGHGRLDTLIEMRKRGENPPERIKVKGEEWIVPVIKGVSFEDDKEAEAYLLADNRLTEIGGWNDEVLGEILKDHEENLWGLGFTGDNLEDLLDPDKTKKEKQDPGAQIDKADELQKKWKVERGQIWEIGKHRLMCGNSKDEINIKTLMHGTQAALGFTSPPYWVGKEYEKEKSIKEIDEFICKIGKSFVLMVRKHRSRIVINTGTGFTTSFDKKNKRHELLLIDKWVNSFFELGWNLRHIRHWIKEGGLQSKAPITDMIDQHSEFIGTFEALEGEPMIFKDIIPNDEVNILEVLYHPEGKHRGQNRVESKWALRSFWNDIKGEAGGSGHCAAFPVELPRRHILLYTQEGEIVADPFLGSGTTMVAAEQLNRICCGMEIEPKYCAVTLERIAGMGLKPKLIK